MIMPWRLIAAHERRQVAVPLRSFTGFVLLQPGQADAIRAPRRVSDSVRQETLRALQRDTDPQHHIWIVSGRDAVPSSFMSLLHATIDQSKGARVDLILALVERNNAQATGYDGFGEFMLLTLELERLGIARLEVPVLLDAHRAGLTSAGWSEHEPGVFVWEKAAHAQHFH